MHLTDRSRLQNYVLALIAIGIAVGSLLVSHSLVSDLKHEERTRMEVWAEAMRSLSEADENTDLNLVLRVMNGNNTIPVIVMGSDGSVQTSRNVDVDVDVDFDSTPNSKLQTPNSPPSSARRTNELSTLARSWQAEGNAICVPLGDNDSIMVCYHESTMLQRLTTYPYVQLSVVTAFMIVCIIALLAAKRAEQNKVWVGLSKETAHQLGTPISSLMAWVEVLKESYPDDELIPELDQDVHRLQMIAERFSKIGSAPELKPTDIADALQHAVSYIKRRTSHHLELTTTLPDHPVNALINAPLFEWVIENLCKNAIDAMHGKGTLKIAAFAEGNSLAIEVTDSGCGIPHNRFESVFRPGYTTKKRGWGLGLSLARRIIQQYHNGRIFVKDSQPNIGTTFRIELHAITNS